MEHFGLQCIIQLVFLVNEISGQSITLHPVGQATVKYDEALNLTCSSNQGLFVFYYCQSGNTKIEMASAGGNFNECQNFNTSEYNLYCNHIKAEYVLTIKNPVHNRTIFCTRSQNQEIIKNKTTIFVEVPFSEVILSPNGMVNVSENTAFTFNCSAKGGRPKGNITWYRNATEVSATSSDLLPNGSLFDMKSTLTISFQNNQSGMIIYCTAKNIDGVQAKKSQNAVIDVKYPPSAAPTLTPLYFSVDEGKSITLQCHLPTLGNPPIKWSWVCGGDNLTLNASNTGTQSTLNFTANRKYDGSLCQCRATSPGTLVSYNKTSNTQIIIVFYTPSTAPTLTPLYFSVDEGESITLQCELPTLGNPPIKWSWVCGDDNLTLNASNTGTQSTLNFTANRKYNRRTCHCTAKSTKTPLSYNRSSQTKNITVFYSPLLDPVLSSNTSLPVEEGKIIILQCFLSTLGNPYITWGWVCGDDNLTLNASNVTTKSTLTFTANRKYNQRTCQCWATSPKPSLSYNKSSAAKIIIVHFAVEIRKVEYTAGSNNMTAGYPVRIKAEIYGNPNSTVVWKIKDSNNILHHDKSVFNVSELSLGKVSCLHTNDYTVTANNSVGKSAFKEISLNVLCSPYLSIDDDPGPFVVGDGKQFIIQHKYIANPKPKVIWNKIEASENITLQNGSQHVTILNFLNGRVNYTTILERKNITINDVGFYNLYLENGLGHYSSVDEVIFRRRPDVPSNISVSCTEPFKAKVSWIAEFDGGGNQSFFIAFSQTGWTSEKLSPASVSGGGVGKNQIVTISDLQPNQEHEFKVYAKNSYGNVSTKSVYCKILDAEAEDAMLLILSTVAVSSLVAIVVIIISIYLYRRYIFANKKEKQTGLMQRLENEHDSSENQDGVDDGLKENVLYISAGPKEKEKSDTAVYADVNKKLQVTNNTSLYAEVEKKKQKAGAVEALYSDVKPKKGFFKRDEKKTKIGRSKQTKENKKKNKPDGTDVYENSEDIPMSTNVDNIYSNAGQKGLNKQKERGYKNKDGLLYVEVNFDGKQGQDNPVIHGEDEKTDYATVEFPMPSSVHKASGGEEL